MQKSKKLFFGISSLTLVLGTTVFASFIPTPNANARSGEVRLSVEVQGDSSPSANIVSPKDNTVGVNNKVPLSTKFFHAEKIRYKAIYKPNTSQAREFDLGIKTNPGGGNIQENWHHQIDVDFDSLAGYGDYLLQAAAGQGDDHNFQVLAEDSIRYQHRPIKIDKIDVDENQEDPVIDVSYGPKVIRIEVQAFAKSDRKPLFEPIIKHIIPAPGTSGIARIKLPFSKYGKKAKDYNITVKSYEIDPSATPGTNPGEDGGIPSDYPPIEEDFSTFTPPSETNPKGPEIPDTGSLFSKINFSKPDYIINGLIGFTAITGMLLFAISKSSRQNSKKRR